MPEVLLFPRRQALLRYSARGVGNTRIYFVSERKNTSLSVAIEMWRIVTS